MGDGGNTGSLEGDAPDSLRGLDSSIATVLCARITWREFKTVFGIREGDWNRYIGELTLIDVVDWCEGIVDVISGKWSLLDIFSCSGDSFYQETRRNDEFYYDARWYYDYGDGKNG